MRRSLSCLKNLHKSIQLYNYKNYKNVLNTTSIFLIEFWYLTEEKQILLLDTSLFSSEQEERSVCIQHKPVTLGLNTTFHLCSTMESTPTVCFPWTAILNEFNMTQSSAQYIFQIALLNSIFHHCLGWLSIFNSLVFPLHVEDISRLILYVVWIIQTLFYLHEMRYGL